MMGVDLKHMLAINPRRSKIVIIHVPRGQHSYSMLFSNQSNFNLFIWTLFTECGNMKTKNMHLKKMTNNYMYS